MKKRKITGALLTVAILIVYCVVTPQNVQAKTNESQIKKLVNQMETYEYEVLSEGKTKVKLTKTEMAKAAAFSIKLTEKDHIKVAESGEDDIYKITNKKLKKAGKNLFGITLSGKNLPQKHKSGCISDAYRKADGTSVVSFANIETELDYVVHSTKVTKKSANKYQVKKKVFMGYWGNNNGQSNYTIVYEVKKCPKSTYGFKITNMRVVEQKSN